MVKWSTIQLLTAVFVLLSLVSFSEENPPDLGIYENLDAYLPSDIILTDENYETVNLLEAIDKPTVIALVYYECPGICSPLLEGVAEVITRAKIDLGTEYQVFTVSFDHEETHVLAAKKKASYLKKYGRPGADLNWHFLVGDKEPIARLADAIGFTYKYIPETDEYAHRSGIVVVTPGGKVSRYFPGVEYDPEHLKFGLMDASKNKIGSLVDRLFLLCYHYDPAEGKYGLIITRVVNIACGLTAVLVIFSVAMFLRFERRRNRQQALAKAGT